MTTPVSTAGRLTNCAICSCEFGENFNITKWNHPSWGVFWHKKDRKILRLTWFYPKFFFEKSSFSCISYTQLGKCSARAAQTRASMTQWRSHGGHVTMLSLVKPCYPKYFFSFFMPNMSTLWVILGGIQSFFIFWAECGFWSSDPRGTWSKDPWYFRHLTYPLCHHIWRPGGLFFNYILYGRT